MRDSMKERIARVISPSAFKDYSACYDFCIIKGDAPEEAMRTAEWAHGLQIHTARALADAVLDALMEPTVEMNAAGFLRNLELGGGKRSPEATFVAMIRAAKEGK